MNGWNGWCTQQARVTNHECGCTKARPHLGTAPFKLSNHSDLTGLQCELQLYNDSFAPNTKQCKTLSLLFLAVKKRDVPPSVLAYKGNYTCSIRSSSGKNVGTFMPDYCQESNNVSQDAGNYSASWFRNQTSMRADLLVAVGTWNWGPPFRQLLMPSIYSLWGILRPWVTNSLLSSWSVTSVKPRLVVHLK